LSERAAIRRVGDGVYLVEHDSRTELVYAVGSAADCWLFWEGHVFHGDFRSQQGGSPAGSGSHTAPGSLTAPMPARVLKVQVEPGSHVTKGDVVVVLEAMKMELPVRAHGNAVVRAVHCRAGELVEADAVLIDLAEG
jgi:biotin carboxyl carrier protein